MSYFKLVTLNGLSVFRFDKSNSYAYIESKRLGRKTYKEQYVYIYR